MTPRRPQALILIALAMLLAVPATASAQDARDPVLDARLSATYGFDPARMEAGPIEGEDCTTGQVEARTYGFTFQDPQNEAQCAQVRFPLRLPSGTDRVEVRFVQDRVVGPDLAGATLPDRWLEQRFRVLDAQGEALFDDPVFAQDQGSVDASPKRYLFDAPGGTDMLVLEWRFLDGGGGFATPAGHSLTSTVRVEGIAFVDIPLQSVLGETEKDIGGRLERFDTHVELPQRIWDQTPLLDATMTLRILDESADVGLALPDGTRLTKDDLSVVLVSGVTRITVDSDVLLESGPGTYRFDVERPTAPLTQGSITQVLAASLFPFAILALATPAALGWVAFRAVHAFRRKCFGPFVATGRSLLATTVLVVVAYGATLLWILLSDSFSAMGRWPVAEPGVRAYALLFVLDVAFVTVWLFADRFLMRAMEEDVARHRSAEEALRARAEELQAFVYGVSHDLKTPVLALDWLTADLEEDLAGAKGQTAQETVRRIRSNVDGMQRLLDDLIAVSRVTTQEEARVAIGIGDVLGEVLAGLETTLEERGTTVTVHAPVEAVVHVEPARLHQVLVNLIGNAAKYGRDDHGRVDVRIHQAAGDHGLTIDIDDDGPGVPSSERERVFHLFQRGDGAIRRKIGGTGIGLALVRKVVDGWGGTVHVHEAPTGGARFRVRLPASRVVSVTPARTAPHPLPEVDTERSTLRRPQTPERRPGGTAA